MEMIGRGTESRKILLEQFRAIRIVWNAPDSGTEATGA